MISDFQVVERYAHPWLTSYMPFDGTANLRRDRHLTFVTDTFRRFNEAKAA
jgi:hypothetical protein